MNFSFSSGRTSACLNKQDKERAICTGLSTQTSMHERSNPIENIKTWFYVAARTHSAWYSTVFQCRLLQKSQNRECTYNVKLKRFRVFTVTVEEPVIYYNCVCIICYPALKVHALYHLWPVRLYHIYPHSLVSDTTSVKQVTWNRMCVLIFPITFFRNIYHSKQNSAR